MIIILMSLSAFNGSGWLRWLHIYSGVVVLLAMVFYAVTGFLLNHPQFSLGKVHSAQSQLQLPVEGWPAWQEHTEEAQLPALTLRLLNWLDLQQNIRGVELETEWDVEEQLLILTFARPGGQTTVEVAPGQGTAQVFVTEQPGLALLNNLHRGKYVSGFWRMLVDLSALCMLLFCLSGLWLLAINRARRGLASVWLGVGSGLFVLACWLMY